MSMREQNHFEYMAYTTRRKLEAVTAVATDMFCALKALEQVSGIAMMEDDPDRVEARRVLQEWRDLG